MIPYFRRAKYAFRTFFSILDHSRVPDDVVEALVSAPRSEQEPPRAIEPDHTNGATQILALLQRDGRLLDFLMEDLAAYPDAQVGAAARDVHAGARKALERYVSITPVMEEAEGDAVTIGRDADPARIKIVGNSSGHPPYRGILRHRGWEATRIDLPPLPTAGRSVLAPAEVEVQ